MEDTKTCIKCKQVKPLSDFHLRKENGKRRGCCIACVNEKNHQDYQSNREERIRKQKSYQATHKQELAESKRRYIEANRDRYDAYHAAYRERNRSKKNEYLEAHYQKNRERILAYKKQYRMGNRDAIRARNSKRKATQRGVAISDFTPKQWIEMKKAFGHRCAYCGDDTAKLTMDHIVPISKGGQHTASNIVPACMACNNHKKCREAPPMVVTPDWSTVQTP